ncbi:cupin domain-containing protein [uncultured Desulfobacter sp.]|uniref:cupin domain-containing protein n=1 Tax=uncultured Desulfobacter sp. TaxID=240139 RepID=UPI002AAAC779|nr:cupin domain-containing protein [uncultured Desulfobacter sp.]
MDILKPIDLIEHPEGGRFREVYRSGNTVFLGEGNIKSAVTHIYFSLTSGEVSRFHKVASDEIWNLYQGVGLNLYTWDGSETAPRCTELSASNNCFCHVIPAGIWQAAEAIAGDVLVGCSVAPGFEFSDFQLIDPNSKEAELLISIAPGMVRYIS